MQRGSFLVRKCALAGVEAMEASTGHVFSRHTHDAFAIGRILKGGQRWWSGHGTVEGRQGQMICSNPGEVHDGAPLGQSRTWKMLYFSPDLVADIVLDINEGRSGEFEFISPVFDHSPKARAFELCYSTLTTDCANSLAAESLIILLFHGLLALPKRRYAAPARDLARVRERIDGDPTVPISLDELAKEVGLSRYQALRGFTRLTGLPPHAYQVQRRIEAARCLIAAGTSVSDAAAASGFADQSHLHRLFVRRFGFTPGAYAAGRR